MKTIEIIFWIFLGIVFYTYIGYGMLLFTLVHVKRLTGLNSTKSDNNYTPRVTLLIAAYNEKDFVDQKVRNNRLLDYPSQKIEQIWVTDGSNDGTPEFLNRGMKHVKSPIVIFSDANTLLSADAVKRIVKLFSDPQTGCVSGEKRISNNSKEAAAGAGEGLYWRYESKLKKWDAELNSVVGAAGELFAVRTELFEEVEPDTLLDDFIISLRIAMKGYSIQYDPEAYAMETASADVKEELKRKIRIAAGGIQSVIRLYPLLNIFRYKTLSFQYISHRVLRWTITPLLIPSLFILNLLLLDHWFYYGLMLLQVLFYAFALLGSLLEHRKLKLKPLFVPYYFFVMNYAVYRGFLRIANNKQSVNWERAKRG